MIKTISVGVACGSLALTLGASWTHFYAKQQINTAHIKMLTEDKRDLTNVVADLNNNQARLIETVSNNSKNNTELREDFKKVLEVLSQNQILISRIAERTKKESN